jgi:mannosyltransferase
MVLTAKGVAAVTVTAHASIAVQTIEPGKAHTLQRPRIRTLAVWLGALAAIVSFAGSWIPSYWGDEAASIMSAERPLSTLFPMLGRIDAVHGLYYLFLHGWIELFGASELSTRLPSAIGVGLAAAGTVVLAFLLFDRRIAVIAGLVFAVLPRVTYMGAEARSYALGTAIAVWLTVLLVVLLTRRAVSPALWVLYSLGFTLAIYSFLYIILLGIVHAIVLLSLTRSRTLVRRWLGAASIGVVLALPVIVYALGQHGQISFLAGRPSFSPQLVFIGQWFSSSWLAILCWALIAIAVLTAVRTWLRGSPRRMPLGMLLAVSWLVIPTLLLVLGNVFVAPMYTSRYPSFCTPAVAILVGVGIAALTRKWIQVVVVALLFCIAMPSYVAQRGPYAKDGGTDWKQASAILGAHARPRDAIVFDEKTTPWQRPRLALHLYPADFARLDDVTLAVPYADNAALWDTVAPLARVADKLANTTTVWAVEMMPTTAARSADVLELERLGFTVQHEYPVHTTTIYELRKSTS